MRQIRRGAGNICFVADFVYKTNIRGVFPGKKSSCCLICLMFLAWSCKKRARKHENMRIMRIHEEGLFKGFYLSCI